jgi:hypothetical protein
MVFLERQLELAAANRCDIPAGSNLIDLDSTSGLRRTSSLRILAAKRNYVSKSFHMRKACRQWSQHVYQRPLSSSQTAPE